MPPRERGRTPAGFRAQLLQRLRNEALQTGIPAQRLQQRIAFERLLARLEQRAPEPMFPAALWRTRVIALGNLGGFANGAVVMAVSGYLPIYVQGAMGESVLSAGMALAASSISWAFASVAAPAG